MELPYDPEIPLLGISPRGFVIGYKQTYVHCSAVHNNQNQGKKKNLKHPRRDD